MVCMATMLGYCVWYDYQRRMDPNYRRKVHERRNCSNTDNGPEDEPLESCSVEECAATYEEQMTEVIEEPERRWPAFDYAALESYFRQELMLGEALCSSYNYTDGVTHYANALLVTMEPLRLLNVLEEMLPPRVFSMLMHRIKHIQKQKRRLSSNYGEFYDCDSDSLDGYENLAMAWHETAGY
ncbi:mitochondrial import receptor subunit TOM20 homolog [Scaptodrosophila lebanonensis]|uniref:Mitochondrial import receptor subunit TOM20 homolog n=1 Tax=Drosophila lebanonensis TaxID=7225 RepID=A0A6J2U2H4_DROLE|nr:mitochondrial import receptor subunit TOM20 homolog [Scaptodrosophila lebanonensis]